MNIIWGGTALYENKCPLFAIPKRPQSAAVGRSFLYRVQPVLLSIISAAFYMECAAALKVSSLNSLKIVCVKVNPRKLQKYSMRGVSLKKHILDRMKYETYSR
jgi:hypothetical protein